VERVCKVDMKRLGLVKDNVHNRDSWRSLTTCVQHCLSAVMRQCDPFWIAFS